MINLLLVSFPIFSCGLECVAALALLLLDSLLGIAGGLEVVFFLILDYLLNSFEAATLGVRTIGLFSLLPAFLFLVSFEIDKLLLCCDLSSSLSYSYIESNSSGT